MASLEPERWTIGNDVRAADDPIPESIGTLIYYVEHALRARVAQAQLNRRLKAEPVTDHEREHNEYCRQRMHDEVYEWTERAMDYGADLRKRMCEHGVETTPLEEVLGYLEHGREGLNLLCNTEWIPIKAKLKAQQAGPRRESLTRDDAPEKTTPIINLQEIGDILNVKTYTQRTLKPLIESAGGSLNPITRQTFTVEYGSMRADVRALFEERYG